MWNVKNVSTILLSQMKSDSWSKNQMRTLEWQDWEHPDLSVNEFVCDKWMTLFGKMYELLPRSFAMVLWCVGSEEIR